jgi:hypothetical protein
VNVTRNSSSGRLITETRDMADTSGPSFTGPISSFEPNVVIAGIEGATVAWLGYAAITGRTAALPLAGTWHWSYAIYGVLAGVGVVLLGLAVEGLAGLVEYGVARHIFGADRGKLRPWYEKAVQPPEDWTQGQRWIWQSEQASQEFSRRRLRLLVCRNTALCVLALTVVLGAAVACRRPDYWVPFFVLDLLAGALLTTLFGWLWVNAHQGWNQAVRDASRLGLP